MQIMNLKLFGPFWTVAEAATRRFMAAEMTPKNRTSGGKLDFSGSAGHEKQQTLCAKQNANGTREPFKAKVDWKLWMGVKTVGQIAREYQVHPVQVTQWKGVI